MVIGATTSTTAEENTQKVKTALRILLFINYTNHLRLYKLFYLFIFFILIKPRQLWPLATTN